MIWNEKQADILKGHNCFMAECPNAHESSQSICRENRLVGLFMIRASIMKISKSFQAPFFPYLFFKCSQMSINFSDN